MQSSSSLMLLIISTILLLVVSSSSSSSPFVHSATTHLSLFFARSELLSGSLSSCASTATSCRSGGIAAADAFIRNHTNVTNDKHLVINDVDRRSSFVQSHPLNWGVNRRVMSEILNYTAFGSVHSLLASTARNITYLRSESFPFLISNAVIFPSNPWVPYVHTVHFDTATKIAAIGLYSGGQTNSFSSIESARGALKIIDERNDGPWFAVIIFGDETVDLDDFVAYVTNTANVARKPAAILDFSKRTNSPSRSVNGTLVVEYDPSDVRIDHHRFSYDDATVSTSQPLFATATHENFDLRTIDESLKDYYYEQKLDQINAEAAAASSNDPIVGQSQEMPVTRTGAFRRCYAGECPLGNLYTDSYLFETQADVAFENSGGIRGPGWAAGNVKVSDIFASLPFINNLCTGKISGVTLYKIVNESISRATFTSFLTNDGGHLLQVSGAKIVYNTNLPETNRLVSIDILNRETKQYEPIQRLKIYNFVTNSFVCTAFDPYPDLFNAAEITGEVKGVLSAETVQPIVANLLGSLASPFDTSIQGRLVNDTSAPSAMASLVQTRASCPVNTFWTETIKSCVQCARGFVNPDPQSPLSSCVVAPQAASSSSNQNAVLIIAIVVPVCILLILLLFLYFRYQYKENVRDLENAPKETGLVGVIFTDVMSSTLLWSTAPLSMSAALETHNNCINEVIQNNDGYLCKTAGDSFLILYDCEKKKGGAQTAAKICVEIQRKLLEASYPSAINKIYNAKNEDDLLDIEDDPNDIENYVPGTVDNGVKVRVGLTIGVCEVKFDPVAKFYDVFGAVPSCASRCEVSGVGGQTLCPAETAKLLDAEELGCTIESEGEFSLKGFTDPVELFSILPKGWEGRNEFFDRVRAEKAAANGEEVKASPIKQKQQQGPQKEESNVSIRTGEKSSPLTFLGAFTSSDQSNVNAGRGNNNNALHSAADNFGHETPKNPFLADRHNMSKSLAGHHHLFDDAASQSDDGFSDAGGDHHSNNLKYQEDFFFLKSAMQAVRPKERATVMRIMETAWRVKKKLDAMPGEVSEDERLATLVRVISKVKYFMMLQQERRQTRLNGESVPMLPLDLLRDHNNNVINREQSTASAHHNHQHHQQPPTNDSFGKDKQQPTQVYDGSKRRQSQAAMMASVSVEKHLQQRRQSISSAAVADQQQHRRKSTSLEKSNNNNNNNSLIDNAEVATSNVLPPVLTLRSRNQSANEHDSSSKNPLGFSSKVPGVGLSQTVTLEEHEKRLAEEKQQQRPNLTINVGRNSNITQNNNNDRHDAPHNDTDSQDGEDDGPGGILPVGAASMPQTPANLTSPRLIPGHLVDSFLDTE